MPFDVTMAHGSRAFQVKERPEGRYVTAEDGTLYVVQQVNAKDGGYEVLCRQATRIECRLYERETGASRN